MNKRGNKKRLILGIILLGFFLIGGYFTWANLTNTYKYFPYNYSSNDAVHLSITASGPNNSLDYYPGGYGILPKKNANGKKQITQFEILNPAVNNSESYSSSPVCNSSGQPFGCVTMNYVFEWTDPNGRELRSIVPAHKYVGQTGFVNVMSDVLTNITLINGDEAFAPGETKELVVDNGNENILVVKTFFGDDEERRGVSFYKDISKKFAFRSLESETVYIGISHSDKTLWGSDNKVPPEKMWKMNFATIHVKANSVSAIPYRAWINPGDKSIRLLTLDMDNIAYDNTSRPELVPYINMYLMREGEDGPYMVNAKGEKDNVPVHRISLQPEEYTKNWKTIPGIDTSRTDHTVGPSGSFLCNKGTIGTPGFIECYNEQAPEFKGITQHTINIPEYDGFQLALFTVNNASTYAGNAFAIAGDIDMFGDDVELEDLLPHLNSGVTGITSVEVDNKTSDGENGFDDDGKETKTKFLHTYKTQVCNNTSDSVNNVLVKLYTPDKTTLVGKDSTEISNSSLLLNGSLLDEPVDESKKLSMATFGSQINMGTLASSECKYLSYQVTVDTDVTLGDELKVKNEYSYNGGSLKYTNEVKNPVLALPYDAEIVLDSEPTPGSDVYLKDFITYKFTVENTGLSDIGSGSVVCGRFSDTVETECKVGDCDGVYQFDNFEIGTEIAVNYAVQVKDGQSPGTVIQEQCRLSYEGAGGNSVDKDSNIVSHTIIDQSTNIYGGDFSLELYSRPKLLNTPDGNPRPDGLDQSPIKYTYRYTGSNHEYMYPDMSKKGSYTDSRGRCSSLTWPNQPNSVTYNIHSTSTYSRSNANFSSNNINFSLSTTLPSNEPQTTLYKGTLTPSHYISGGEANSWFKSGGEKVLPLSSTEHRALENGTDGRIESEITGTTHLDTWKYVPYDTGRCSYSCRCGEDGCDTCSRSYMKYQWEFQNRETVEFDAQAYRFVTVGGSSAWLKTSNGHVHTNDKLTEDGTSSNNYDLGESGYTNVKSAPKLYAPVGAFHGDYIVSSNTSTTNLKSKENWYLYNKQVQKGHGYVYDRAVNSRDFYTDLIEKQKFGPVETMDETSISRIEMELNHIYYYPGDLTIERPGGNVIVAGKKGTIVVEGDLYINSNIKYSIEEKDSLKNLPYLGLIVKGNVYIDGSVTDTVGTWHIDKTLHTGESVQTLKHLGNWTGDIFDFQRKAPEFYERDVNEPSEWIYFDDRIYITTPPGFAELDDGVWSYKNNINQFTGEEVEW